MKWKKGESGNPGGRKPGTGKVERIRAAIAKDIPDILQAMVDAAKGGDVAAGKALLDRVCPPLKAVEAPIRLPLPEGALPDRGRAVIAEMATGRLSPGQAAALLAALADLGRVIEVYEQEQRIHQLRQERIRQ